MRTRGGGRLLAAVRSAAALAALTLCSLPAAALAGGLDSSFPDFLDLQNRALYNPATPADNFRTTSPDGLAAGEVSLSGGGLVFQHRVLELPGHPIEEDLVGGFTGAYGFDDRLTLGAALPFVVRDRKGSEAGLLDLALFGRYRFSGERGQGMRWGAELLLGLPTGSGGDLPGQFSLDTAAARLRLLGAYANGDWELGGHLGYQAYGATASGNGEGVVLGGAYATLPIAPGWRFVGEYTASRHSGGNSILRGDDSLMLGARYTWTPRLTVQALAGAGVLRPEETWRVAGQLVYSWERPAASSTAAPPAPPAAVPAKDLAQVPPPPPMPAPAGTVAPAKPSAPRLSVPIARPFPLRIEVANRSGARGAGKKVADFLTLQGFPVEFVDDSILYVSEATHVFYAVGRGPTAGEIANKIRRDQKVEMHPFPLSEVEILVVVGTDLAD